MIVLKITNASEVIATHIGGFLEKLTPDSYDNRKIEDILIDRLVASLSEEGLKGEVAAVKGFDLQGSDIVLQDRMHVRVHRKF
jgi:hypothetical protein